MLDGGGFGVSMVHVPLKAGQGEAGRLPPYRPQESPKRGQLLRGSSSVVGAG